MPSPSPFPEIHLRGWFHSKPHCGTVAVIETLYPYEEGTWNMWMSLWLAADRPD